MWAGGDRLDPVGRGACRGRAPCQGADRLCAGVPGGQSGRVARRPIDRGGIGVKLAVVGKGGSGKTTTAAVIARTLARRGMSVVALDCRSEEHTSELQSRQYLVCRLLLEKKKKKNKKIL